VTGDALGGLGPAERDRVLLAASVVARVDPATKLALVEAHRAAGHVVAMTGDGVNDAPALRRADIGVALAGEGGTDVAREAAALVVTDGDLATVVEAVGEGRRTYRNLQTVVGYLVTGNLSEILTLALCLLALPALAVPLLPAQLLWVNLVTDGLPAVALGVDRPATDPLAAAPRGRQDRLLPLARLLALALRAGVIAALVVLSGRIATAWGWTPEQVRTELLLTLLIAHLGLAYVVRASRWTFERGWSRNRLLLLTVIGSLGLQAVAVGTPVGRALLGLTTLPPSGWLLATGCGLGSLVALEALRALGPRRR
jgi:Ca2+-transporting ATPase